MIFKNKKGDVAVTIFVVGVVAVCIFAIFSFISTGNIFKNDFASGINLIEEAVVVEEQVNFYHGIGKEVKEIVLIIREEYPEFQSTGSDEEIVFYKIVLKKNKDSVKYSFSV